MFTLTSKWWLPKAATPEQSIQHVSTAKEHAEHALGEKEREREREREREGEGEGEGEGRMTRRKRRRKQTTWLQAG